jgi:hypothetical protein
MLSYTNSKKKRELILPTRTSQDGRDFFNSKYTAIFIIFFKKRNFNTHLGAGMVKVKATDLR